LFNSPRLLWIAGGVLAALALIPGLPKISFLSLAGVLMFTAWKMKPRIAADDSDEAAVTVKGVTPGGSVVPGGDPVEIALRLDELMLEVGMGLVPMVDAKQGGQLLSRVKSMRKSLALQLGFLVPSIHITDNLSLKDREYVIYLRGVEIARWEMRRDCLLAISSSPDAPNLPGQVTREPAFNVAATWIAPQVQGQAIAAGYAVVDATSVLAAHLAELIKQNAHELLSRQETKRLIDRLGESHPKLADELIPKLMSLGEVQRVLQQLLREQVSIRDLGSILETLIETAAFNKNPVALVETVRHMLGRALIHPLLDQEGGLKVVTLDAAIEEECTRGSNQQQNQMVSTTQHMALARRVLDGLRASFGPEIDGAPPVLLCSSPGRYYLRRLLEPFIPRVVVISPGEIPPMTQVQSVGVVQ
ncbi:MAG: flagellar biosynthesis protein FlhA, partial [Acidobacteriaceae bacterium]|nr:flagellar biosynthesis protein FlhA [Acidobacteriaceae bacterium]